MGSLAVEGRDTYSFEPVLGDVMLTHVNRISSLETTGTRASIDSLSTIADGDVLMMGLSILCDYIHDHKSLASAEIMSASTYTQRSKMLVKHRFLLLHLRRKGKKEVYLRLDRLRSEELSAAGFVAAGGQVAANDIVRFRTLGGPEDHRTEARDARLTCRATRTS